MKAHIRIFISFKIWVLLLKYTELQKEMKMEKERAMVL